MDDVERTFTGEVDVKEMWKHLEFLCAIDRTSGTPGEDKAMLYIADVLKSYGVTVKVHEFKAYLSYPVSAKVVVDGTEIQAKTRAFSDSTPVDGIEGEIVYVPGGSDMFTDTETVERLKQADLTGKIVLSEGGGRDNMIMSRRLGAVGYIHMWPSDEDVIHEGIVTPVWGTPTPETADSCPKIPVVSIKRKDGLKLKEMAEKGTTKVRLFTVVETGWKRVLLPEATIPGKTDDFVLIGGHLDSWHLGATDNASGNVVCLELARLLKKHQESLRRGVRICWWPGHSTGRYAGSTWYCDQNWQDLRDHCVTYINIDSPGPLGAYDYSEVTMVAENEDFISEIVEELTGQAPKAERPVRAGDQSFWGPGVTSAFMLLSNRPEGQRAAVGGSGMGWWWHTEADTIDKVEPAVLEKDCKIYALASYRLCTLDVLPHKVAPLATELETEIAKLEKVAGSVFDLGPAVRAAKRLVEVSNDFDAAVSEIGPGACKCAIEAANKAMLEATRVLTPVRYSPVPPTEHGPATPTKPVPVLQPLTRLARLSPESDEFGFLKNSLVRKQNAVVRAFIDATRALEAGIREIR
ncbi:MAG: M28 family peptidase [Bacillota bacterium]|jgi:N-acetylated-alpha-linked acidic dipeptidase|nr:M28 family peptidase [Candidatus Fermentithermobacillaceae bacterium]